MIVGDNSFSSLIVFQSSPVASYKECCSQCTARVSPRRTCTIEALISANFLAIGWNSNDIPSRLAKFASCFFLSQPKSPLTRPCPSFWCAEGPPCGWRGCETRPAIAGLAWCQGQQCELCHAGGRPRGWLGWMWSVQTLWRGICCWTLGKHHECFCSQPEENKYLI